MCGMYCTGRPPFGGDNYDAILESVVTWKMVFPSNDARYKTPLKLSEDFKDFVTTMLNKDALKRPSIDECMHHPWLFERN